jgi:hypothetical protein
MADRLGVVVQPLVGHVWLLVRGTAEDIFVSEYQLFEKLLSECKR